MSYTLLFFYMSVGLKTSSLFFRPGPTRNIICLCLFVFPACWNIHFFLASPAFLVLKLISFLPARPAGSGRPARKDWGILHITKHYQHNFGESWNFDPFLIAKEPELKSSSKNVKNEIKIEFQGRQYFSSCIVYSFVKIARIFTEW